MVFPLRAEQLINHVGFVPTDEQMKESWSAPGDPAALAAEFAGWDPLVEAVLERVTTCFAGACMTVARCPGGVGGA
jgi:salicylate hydroxylase